MRIQIQDVSVRFGPVTALGGVSVDLEPGRVTVLVGPNGAGKSTLMGVLLGLVRPDAGRVVIDGRPFPGGLPLRMRGRLGYLPEAVAFADNLTGRQVLRFFASARGLPRGRVEAVLARVGLSHAAGRAVSGYSRGMRQRLGLGVATLSEPDLLVLDEPTGGLDQDGLSLLWELLAEYRAAGRTVLVTTHDLALIERRADHLCVLRDGVVRAAGSPDALRRMVGLPVRVSIELSERAAVGSLLGELQARHLGEVEVEDHRLVVNIEQDRLLDVLRAVDRRAPAVHHLRVEEPGLDSVYAHLLEVA